MSTDTVTLPTSLPAQLTPGPVAVIRNEDNIELASTIDHFRKIGFENIVVAGLIGDDLPQGIIPLAVPPLVEASDLLNSLMAELAGHWVYYGHNAEYLYFPFCEGRTIADAAQFTDEERRSSIFAITVDLYPQLINREAITFDLATAHFDNAGYYRRDRFDGPEPQPRQIDIFGGLKWRFAEHVQWERQRINRVPFFRASAGLTLDAGELLSDPELNTISCPWHNNMTFAVASFRVAKSLLNNPGSTFNIETFMWDRSEKFARHSDQLLEFGFMEPGQWF